MASEQSVDKLNGQVKWFNNRKNYGFITVTSPGERSGTDVFVHQSNIRAEGYRTLSQGEYVSFVLSANDKENSEAHPFHATDVTGVDGGKLKCDFDRQSGVSRPRRNFRQGGFRPRYNRNRGERQQQAETSSE